MNILPLVLVLLLMLSAITIEKLDKFKSLTIVQKEYQVYLAQQDRQVFNQRQKLLCNSVANPSQRQLSFTLFFDKTAREAAPEKLKQTRLILTDLMKVLYGEAAFFKELESRRSNFIDELLDDFMASADRLKEKHKIRRIEDIRRVRLSDPELQEAFYRMLKGTISKEQLQILKEMPDSKDRKPLSERHLQTSYLPLLSFLKHKTDQKISVQRSSRELLTAIFGKEDVVEAIIARRNELDPKKSSDASVQFANEFKGKQKPGISDELLDFEISSSNKTPYN